MDRRSLLRMLGVASGAAILGGCGSGARSVDLARIASYLPRDTSPDATCADLAALVAGNTRFAFSLYGRQSRTGNLFFSPHSISLALAMAYAGARGDTATQMAAALGYDLPDARLHAAFNALDLALAQRAVGKTAKLGFRLRVTNAMWGQRGQTFLAAFLDTLATNYGAGMRVVDYAANAESARLAINTWVSEQTVNRINDLLPPGSVTEQTRLVLTNASYFVAPWYTPFWAARTGNAAFTTLAGATVSVPTMIKRDFLYHGSGDGWQAVDLPCGHGEVRMLLLVPDAGRFAEVDAALDRRQLDWIRASIRLKYVTLALPKFGVESTLSLATALRSLGMTEAFDGTLADLSGIDGQRDLAVSDVLHRAYLRVNENGTETAVARPTHHIDMAAEPVTLTIDRPFILLVRDRPTGALLFLGRVADPSG